ncbi:hypothetical protein COB18_00425 [Candidatus Kaiserbacteria bacterium]|nr:MAG: hypothetical protein COB18_00425 [Candidatus Kaiserbacteria bacterium]
MNSIDFDAVVNKFLKADDKTVIEAAMEVFKGIQEMDAATVVSFWRALMSFYQFQETEKEKVVGRQMLEEAYARMLTLRDDEWSEYGEGIPFEIATILATYKHRKDT